MSSGETGEAGEDASAPRKVARTVTPPYLGRPDREMDVLGWGYFLGMLVLLVPLLPFILILWLGAKLVALLRGARRRVG